MAPRRPRPEQGFALLVVFLMASVIAITLYMELPRVAMQAQRDKEEMLIDRGEQYKRAIQLFVNKAKRYPGDIKELESFQNQRFLRKRYIDPMTGKDEWRLIHIQAGVLTDSKLSKPTGPGGKEEPKGPNGFVGELAGLGGVQNPTQGGATSARDRRRASDGTNATMPGTGLPGGDLSGNSVGPPIPGQAQDNAQSQQPGNPQGQLSGQITGPLPGQLNGQPGMTIPGQQNGQGVPGQQGSTGQPGLSGQQMYPGQQFPGQQNLAGQQGFPGQTSLPGQQGVPGMPGMPATRTNTVPTNANSGNSFVGGGGSLVGGGYSLGGPTTPVQPANNGQPGYPGQPLPGQPGPPVNSQVGGVSPYSTQPGANGMPVGFPQPGQATGAPGNAAADMIRNILTTPRPGGMPQGMAGAQTLGGGIAGVASNGEGEGVKVYNDRTLYQEWEFVFDPQKQKQIPNPNVQGAGGTPADRMNQGTQPGTQPGTGNPGPTTPNVGPRLPGR